MPDRNLPLSGPAHAKIPGKLLGLRVRVKADRDEGAIQDQSKGHPSSLVLERSQFLSLSMF